MSAEPGPVSLSVRAGYDASLGLDEFQIEARFADGQKYSVATVDGEHPELADLFAAAPALLEACEAAVVALEHDAPGSCWATGPNTGDPVVDLVMCPGCNALTAIRAAISAARKGE